MQNVTCPSRIRTGGPRIPMITIFFGPETGLWSKTTHSAALPG